MKIDLPRATKCANAQIQETPQKARQKVEDEQWICQEKKRNQLAKAIYHTEKGVTSMKLAAQMNDGRSSCQQIIDGGLSYNIQENPKFWF